MSMESRPPSHRDHDERALLYRLSLLLVEAEGLATGLAMDFAALRIEEVAMMVQDRAFGVCLPDDWSGIQSFH